MPKATPRVYRAQVNPIPVEAKEPIDSEENYNRFRGGSTSSPRYQDDYKQRVGGLRETTQPGRVAETKRDKFHRVAEVRVNNAIKGLREIQKLGNPEVYDFTDDDRALLVGALQAEIDMIDEALQKKGKPPTFFRFGD